MNETQTNSFKSFSKMVSVVMRLKPGEDLKHALDKYIKEHQIRSACLLSCCGSLQQATIRYAGKKDTDVLKGKFEIVSLIIYITAEIVMGILTDYQFNRVLDSESGYKELEVKTI